ncbi:AAA family ATPase [Bernardetia sp. Wsw4-3y2]|uniref:AAA family ATPase n=1 Tax=Bernardetia sp. Wsw4-3y2 TaxID=3127471 RepID=UPI0030CDA748
MELIYLWVEKYKNIKNEGFNFSPKYHFEYISETNTLEFVENETVILYQESFFGEHITNVTAIIGQNGSGKSSVLECLLAPKEGNCILVFKQKVSLENEENKYQYIVRYYAEILISKIEGKSINTNNEEGETVIEVKKADKSYIFKCLNSNSANYSLFPSETEKQVSIIFYSDYYDEIKENLELVKEVKDISFFHRFHKHEEGAWNDFKYRESISKMNLIKDFTNNDVFPFKLPNRLRIKLNYDGIHRVYKNAPYDDKLRFPKEQHRHDKKLNFDWKPSFVGNEDSFFTALEWLIFYSSFTHVFFQNLLLNATTNDLGDINNAISSAKSLPMKSAMRAIRVYLTLNKQEQNYYDIQQLERNLEEFMIFLRENISWEMGKAFINIDKGEEMIEKLNTFNKLTSPITFSWYKDTKPFYFSSGENIFLRLFSSLYYLAQNELSDNLIIIIDEGELGMHPQWQKKYLKNLLEILPKIFPRKKAQIILTSHSSFLVSDLPKENIVFLKKGDNDLCKVEPLIEQEKTFGQNIHTLLSDSFFLEDGVVGDFALDKINSYVKKINEFDNTEDAQSKIKEIDHFINLIGDKLIRTHLKMKLEILVNTMSRDTQKNYYQRKIDELNNEGGNQ